MYSFDINQFIGMCEETNKIYLIMEYISRGSLRQLLKSEQVLIGHLQFQTLCRN